VPDFLPAGNSARRRIGKLTRHEPVLPCQRSAGPVPADGPGRRATLTGTLYAETQNVPSRCEVLREEVVTEPLRVWIDQDLCTGDGLCVQYAPEVFEFDIDGLAYVKGSDGELRTEAGGQAAVPPNLRLDVLDSAKECPGECIHVVRVTDGAEVAGPAAG
jgi:ferredoxin